MSWTAAESLLEGATLHSVAETSSEGSCQNQGFGVARDHVAFVKSINKS